MKEVGGRKKFHEVTYDDTPIDLHAADIEDRLSREGKPHASPARDRAERNRSEMIGVFLALLELIREKKNPRAAGGGAEDELKSSPPRKSTAARTPARRCTCGREGSSLRGRSSQRISEEFCHLSTPKDPPGHADAFEYLSKTVRRNLRIDALTLAPGFQVRRAHLGILP
jgi:hypothetical protein